MATMDCKIMNHPSDSPDFSYIQTIEESPRAEI
jgi:hypothetical protein